ncbi:reverse transcriptase domain-containing protein [Tanacetum coccineum]
MAELDEEKTAFHTSHRVYCYTKMPFGLKNAGAIYQRLVDKAFDSQVGQNIEVYIDDLVIKSHTKTEMLRDIDETLRTIRKINMKLNPQKCTFGAVEGMFLRYMISLEGIKPCPDKIEGPKRSKASMKYIKKSDFHWTPEAEQAFKQLKAISAVLMTKWNMVQTPVYFVSRALQGPELNYTPMEKLVLALVFAAKRLRRYFQVHPIAVITNQPIKQLISCPDILADFLVEKPDEALPNTSVVETPFQFTISNNESEYEALIAGLWIAAQIGVRNVHVSVDSKLVANQVLGTYFSKEENMIKYHEKAKSLVSDFANFSISQVPRSKNKKADALSKIASTRFARLSKHVLVEVLKEKSLQEKEGATVVEKDGPTWMKPIMEYLKDGTLPNDRKEVSKLRLKAR